MPRICFGTLTKIHRKCAVHLRISILFYRRSKPILRGANYRQRVEHRVPRDFAPLCGYFTLYTYMYTYTSCINRLIMFQYQILFHRHSILLPLYKAMKLYPNKHELPTVLSLCAEENLTSSSQHNS
jgi:hypothetical protein